MPQCPNCDSEIDGLNAFCYEQNKYTVHLIEDVQAEDGSWMLDWSTSEVVESTETQREFTCPECEVVIFRWKDQDYEKSIHQLEDEVIAFLAGEALQDEGDPGELPSFF